MPAFKTMKIVGGNEQFCNVDSQSDSLQIINYAHHKVHEGDSYNVPLSKTIGASVNHIITFTTSGACPHLVFEVCGTAVGHVALYETVVSSGGSALAALNHNRNSVNTSLLSFIESSTVTTTGTLMDVKNFGSGKKAGGLSKEDNEWVLKTDTKYALFIQSSAANNAISATLSWYE